MEHPSITALIDANALFVVNHSGGKDSQAMLICLRQIVPQDQLVIVHAQLPEVDWEGIPKHIEATCFGIPVHYCQAGKTFFEMVEHRGMFPSPQHRQCTSDLKRDPINKAIRAIVGQTGHRIIVNCMGLRAEESSKRSKLEPLRLNERNSIADRDWYDWLPIHDIDEATVFGIIADAGQSPHWAYQAGMSRLSCCFCIMASAADIATARKLKPDLHRRYAETERRLGHTLQMPIKGVKRFLDQLPSQEAA